MACNSLSWLLVELKNSEQDWLLYLELWGYNIGYFFTASKEELSQYYPRFSWFIFVFGRALRYGMLPLVFLLMYRSVSVRNWIDQLISEYRKLDVSSFTALLLGPLSALMIGIAGYILLLSKVFQPFEFQLWIARIWLVFTGLHFIGLIAAQRKSVSKALRNFMFKQTLPYSAAIFRVLFFSYMAAMYIVAFPRWGGMFIGKMPVDAPFLTGWFWEFVPVEMELYKVICWICAGLAISIVVGFKTRAALIVHGILCFYVITVPNIFGKIWHIQIMIWISWIMAFSRCFDVLSIDSLKQRDIKKGPYDFHLKLIWLQFGLIYLFGGFHKLWLCGFDWALSDSMVNQFRLEWFEHYDLVPSFRIDQFPGFLKVSGLLVILFELFFVMFMFRGRLRAAAVSGGLFMHLMIERFLYISFFSVLVVFYVVFIPWNRLIQRFKKIDFHALDVLPEARNKLVYWVPAMILVVNFWFGLLNINSYPFSVYPVYASLVPDTVQYLDFVPVESDLDIWQKGKKADFRWENFTRDQYDLISQYNATGNLDSARVNKHWQLWKKGVQSLNEVEQADVYLITRHLDPEKAAEKKSELLYRISE